VHSNLTRDDSAGKSPSEADGPRPSLSTGSIPDEWSKGAPALASWTFKHVVNRHDAFGHYIAVENRKDPDLTAFTDKNALTLAVLQRHYEGQSTGDLIGLHSTVRDEAQGEGEAAACWSRWLGVDIDCHDESVDTAVTLEAGGRWFDRARELGFDPLLLDSNGGGGYHLILLFDGPVATDRVHRFGKWLTRDWQQIGLGKPPEIFPKQERIPRDGYGNWLRMPGRHHTRDHYTEVWDHGFDWVAGHDAIKVILKTTGTPSDKIPEEATKAEKPARPKRVKIPNDMDRDAKLAREALPYLHRMAGDYDSWLRIGMSLTPLGTVGLSLWEEWSQTCPEKYSEGACERKWRTFGSKGVGDVTLGTLFHEAKRHGWDRTRSAPLRNGTAHRVSAVATADGDGSAGRRTATNTEPPERPQIEITTERHDVLQQTIKALARDPEIYYRGPALVEIATLKEETVKLTAKTALMGTAGAPAIIMMSEPVIGCCLTRNASFYQMRESRKGEPIAVDVHPPDWLIRSVATHKYWPGLRPLIGIAECPFPKEDGTIQESKGYDPDTGTFLRPSITFPAVPERPTQDDARAAWGRLKEPFRQFPFQSENDLAVLLAAILTAISRPSISGPVPGTAVVGNRAGIGKAVLIDAVGTIAHGRRVPTTTYPADPAEAGKVKVAMALAGKRIVHLDNLEEGSTYGNPNLDSALTTPSSDDRILGTSQMTGDIPLQVCWFLSGNNLSPAKDAFRRWLSCNLVSNLEHPEQRDDLEIGDLRGYLLERRGELVRDALTILRAHALVKRPKGNWGPLGSYEHWDKIVRGAVWFATDHDCCATLRKAADEAPDRQAKIALLAGWLELPESQGRGVTTADAIELVTAYPTRYPALRNALTHYGRDGKLVTSRDLGTIIRGIKGAPHGEMKFEEAGKKHHAVAWKVVKVAPDPRNKAEKGECGSPGSVQPIPAEEKNDDSNYTSMCGGVSNTPRAECSGRSPSSHTPPPTGATTWDAADNDVDWTKA
jgi:hypothetical protein